MTVGTGSGTPPEFVVLTTPEQRAALEKQGYTLDRTTSMDEYWLSWGLYIEIYSTGEWGLKSRYPEDRGVITSQEYEAVAAILKPSPTHTGVLPMNHIAIPLSLAQELCTLLVDKMNDYKRDCQRHRSNGEAPFAEMVSAYLLPPLERQFDELIKAWNPPLSSSTVQQVLLDEEFVDRLAPKVDPMLEP